MGNQNSVILSVVVPLYNESEGLEDFNTALTQVLETNVNDRYEVIYCDDGSVDDTAEIVRELSVADARIKLVKLSRNFGKENALTAGIAHADGKAILMIDGDGQHPVELIPKFFEAWKKGAQVVVGVRDTNEKQGWVKAAGSRLFYKLFNMMTDQKLLPNSTDFRLIDKIVQKELLGLKETNRITRGLIDWLGFRKEYINFKANARTKGTAGYSVGKLMQLAANSFVSLTPKPLYLFGYLGSSITIIALLLGSAVFIEQLLLGDPLHWKFTGTAMLAILLLFLVGIVLISQGILSLYISHIHSQSKGRPLYIIDYQGSEGIEDETKAKADNKARALAQ